MWLSPRPVSSWRVRRKCRQPADGGLRGTDLTTFVGGGGSVFLDSFRQRDSHRILRFSGGVSERFLLNLVLSDGGLGPAHARRT